jgi:hypothetical protein
MTARNTTAASKPKFQVVEDTFIAQSSEGEIKIPMRFKTKLFRKLRELPDEIDQVFALLDGLGDPHTAEQLDELDLFEMTELVEAFFAEFEKKNEAKLGEASRSSNS